MKQNNERLVFKISKTFGKMLTRFEKEKKTRKYDRYKIINLVD